MNETIEQIVCELRSEPLAEGGAKPWLHYLADRIEAAWKREREQSKSASKYVYAIQKKHQGHWRVFEDGFSSPDETKELMNEMRQIHPHAEFRIARRPAMLWAYWEAVE